MKGIIHKNALVTGASSGIGQAIAVRLAQEGANVVINYYDDQSGAEATQAQVQAAYELMAKNSLKSLLYKADVSDNEQVTQMFNWLELNAMPIDILINNAGIQNRSLSHETDPENFQKVMAINLNGSYFCAVKAIRNFLKRQIEGVIINVSSVHELIPRPQYLSYAVSKGALHSLTETLALEYAPHRIRVNSIGPGATKTPINQWSEQPSKVEKVAQSIPMKRMGNPEEMAAAVAFLVSDEATYITGQTLFIDGGLTLYPSFQTPFA